MKQILFTVLFIFLFQSTLSRNPGLRSTITQNGIRYATQVGIDVLKRELVKINIPNLVTRVGTPVGTVELTISELRISHLDIPQHNFNLQEQVNRASLQLSQVAININFRWRWRKTSWPNLSDSGSGSVRTGGNGISADISPFVRDGKPQVTVTNVGFSIGSFSISLSGGASWLYDLLLPIFRGDIKNAIERAVRDNAGRIINSELNELMMKLPTTVRIPVPNDLFDMGIDWSILTAKIFSSHVSLGHRGEFYRYSNRQNTNIPSKETPTLTQTGKMLELIVNEYFGETAGEVLHNQGFFKLTVTDDMLPSDSPIRLRTNAFNLMIPNLSRLHPNKFIVLRLKTTQKPEGNITKKEGIRVYANSEIEWLVVNENGSLEQVFVFNTKATLEGKADVKDNKLVGNLTLLRVESSVKSSNIGDININVFNNLINVLFVRGILPVVNKLLNAGVELPTVPDLKFLEPTVAYNDGYLSVSLNVRYTVFETRKIIDSLVSLD